MMLMEEERTLQGESFSLLGEGPDLFSTMKGVDSAASYSVEDEPNHVPKNYTVKWSAEKIARAVTRMAGEINEWLDIVVSENSPPLLAIPILQGGTYLAKDLCAQLRCKIEEVPIKNTTYDTKTNQQLEHPEEVDISFINCQGRVVLLIDDMSDSGESLKALKKRFEDAGATVRCAVLIDKEMLGKDFQCNYVGFSYDGPEWLVGYGLDSKGEGRELRNIYIMKV